MSGRFTAAVIVPARNEARRIASCLAALAPQVAEDVLVVVVANNCTDGTARAARGVIPQDRFALLDCTLGPAQGVGAARRQGCLHALTRHPGIAQFMTTDADCIVAGDWIAANRRHLAEVDAVCGRVDPIATETSVLTHMPQREAQDEATYRNLVLRFYGLLAPEAHNASPHHGEAPGASLACRASAWSAVGGFADMRSGEDRHLVRHLRGSGFRVRHAEDVRVHASCRLKGRAPGGMADTLRARLAGEDYSVDEALPPVDMLIGMARRGRLEAWPPDTPAAARLRPADLPGEIRRLQSLLAWIESAPQVVGIANAHPAIPMRRIGIPPAVPPEGQSDAQGVPLTWKGEDHDDAEGSLHRRAAGPVVGQ